MDKLLGALAPERLTRGKQTKPHSKHQSRTKTTSSALLSRHHASGEHAGRVEVGRLALRIPNPFLHLRSGV